MTCTLGSSFKNWIHESTPSQAALKGDGVWTLDFEPNLRNHIRTALKIEGEFGPNLRNHTQFAPSRSRVRDRLHLQIVDKANQLRKTLISRHDIGRTQSLEGAFRPSAVLTTFYHFISESAWVLYHVLDRPWPDDGTLPCVTPWRLIK